MFKSLIVFITITTSVVSWATKCPQDVQAIEESMPAPCDGVLLSPDASKQVEQQQQDAKYYKALSEKLQVRQDYMQKEVNILDERLKLYVNEADVLARHKNLSNWEKVGYFTLGLLVMGEAVHEAARFNR